MHPWLYGDHEYSMQFSEWMNEWMNYYMLDISALYLYFAVYICLMGFIASADS